MFNHLIDTDAMMIFALSIVDEVVSKNPFEALKSTNRVDVLIRFTIMEKFKQNLNLNDVCAD